MSEFKFSELEGRAKDRAADKLREWITDHEWWDCVYEQAKEDGKARGFEIEDISFRGFWSQGDGASWTGEINLNTFLSWALEEAAKPDTEMSRRMAGDIHRYEILHLLVAEDYIDRTVSVSLSGFMYAHSGMMRVSDLDGGVFSMDIDDEDVVCSEHPLQGASIYQLAQGIDCINLLEDFYNILKEQATSFADDIYRKLEDEYDHLTSDESLEDFAEANEYKFDEEGRVV